MLTHTLVTIISIISLVCLFILAVYYVIITAAEQEKTKQELTRCRREAEENKRLTEEALKQKGPAVLNAEKELSQVRAEAEKLKRQLDEKTGQLKAKQERIQRLNEQLAGMNGGKKEFEQRMAELKKIESDILWLEKVVNEQKEFSRRMKQRIEETRIKMQLLNEKTKESVELIAGFAGTKQFDEFRKTIHLDEIIQKYENQIKDLKIKNIELGKKLGIDTA
jgi:chromosome segregation ATPase